MNSKRKRKENFENFCFTIPAVILVCMMMYIPFVMSGFYSLTEWNGISKAPAFVGLKNFKDIFSGSSDYVSSLLFTIRYTFVFVILSNIVALALAVALTKKFKLANVYRSLFFIPYIMSMTIVGFIWKFIFTKGFETLYGLTGWEFWNYSWLGQPSLAFYSVAFVGVWQSLGFYIVLYIAGLQAVPSDVLEAAVVDGANILQQIWYVELPAIKNIIVIQFILQAGNIMSIGFEKAYALQTDMNLPASEILSTYVYRIGLLNGDYGYSTAVGLFNSVVNVILLIFVNWVVKKLNDGEGL